MWHLAASNVVLRRPASLGACLRWLLVWLPGSVVQRSCGYTFIAWTLVRSPATVTVTLGKRQVAVGTCATLTFREAGCQRGPMPRLQPHKLRYSACSA